MTEKTFLELEPKIIEGWYLFWVHETTCSYIDVDGHLSTGQPIKFDQIAGVYYIHEEDDTWDWRGEALVRLNDGKFAYLTAWSETTFDDANHFVATSFETLFKYAMSPKEAETIKKAL